MVAVDANGADLGPAEVAAGAVAAAEQGARVLLFGPAHEMDVPPALAPAPGAGAAAGSEAGTGSGVGTVEVIDAPVSIAKSADPVQAARSTPESSIVQAARAVAAGRAQALVCAGGTGAAVAAGLFNVKRARGIHRPALALPLPVPGRVGGHSVTLLDVGANAQARREHLVQFAFMGAALAQAVLGVEQPRVGVLSNGEEAQRGSALVVESSAELWERMHDGPFRFVGNVEGTDVVGGAADVIVTDGFTGNVALKLMEGVSQTMLGAVRQAAMSSPRSRLGGLLLRPALRGFRDEIDPEAHGGAYLLGLRSLGVVPHGRFTSRGFAQAILRAQRGAQQDVVSRTQNALEQAGALKVAPMSARGDSLREDR